MYVRNSVQGPARRLKPLAGALALTLLGGLAFNASASINNTAVVADPGNGVLLPIAAGDVAYYTVVFKDAPVATYAGELQGYAVPARLNGGESAKLDLKSEAALAYVSLLESKQSKFVADLQSEWGRPVNVMAQMQHALNAVIIGLTNSEAVALSKRSDVLIVEREHELELHTDAGPNYINAPAIWEGLTASGVATKGEGIIVGIIDTGINWESAAYAAVGPIDGYVHQNPLGTGNYLGLCKAGQTDVGRCNDKLIGMYNFSTTSASRSGVDTQGHGSHTSSTVAGNRWKTIYASGEFEVSGVAPHANIISYLACPSSCPTTATQQSVNQAIIDGVDVINFSISGGASPWSDTTSVAFRNAHAAGMYIAASAGNTSTTIVNPQGQVNHLEPWVHTVAASTHDRVIGVSLKLDDAGAPPNTQDVPMRPGGAPLPTVSLANTPIIKSPNFANGGTDGCSAYPADTFTRVITAPVVPADRIFSDAFDGPSDGSPTRVGALAVLHLDSETTACASGARQTAALNAGAIGVIFVYRAYLNLGANNYSWSMLRSDWDNLEAAMTPASSTASVNIAASSYPGVGDVVAGFSLRGPKLMSNQILVKPDITAPGVDILAVGAANVVGPQGTYLSNGTSMSSPHMAGAAALMRALQPTWSPTQIKSALTLTAKNTGAVNEDSSPVRPWDYGTGMVNLAAASKAGLIQDETAANYLAANPAAGGDLSTLNLPSFAKYNINGTAEFKRTFRRAQVGTQTYTLSATGLPADAVEFLPASFTINTSGSREITLRIKSQYLAEAQWSFGELTLTPASGDEPTLNMPIAVYPGGPAIAATPAMLSATTATTATANLTISNIGNPTLNWESVGTGDATITPINSTQESNGQLAGEYSAGPKYTWYQNFDVSGPLRITRLAANGFILPSGNLTNTNTTGIRFAVYADDNGKPAGAPSHGALPVWTYTSTISAANGITVTSGVLSLNLNAANVASTPLNLAPGRYWLSVTPAINGNASQTTTNPIWAWRISADAIIGNAPYVYDAADPGVFEQVLGVGMMSSIVQGTASCATPAWASLSASSGALGYAGTQVVTVTFDAAGLTPGATYSGNLCFGGNATNTTRLVVPVSLTVPPTP